MSRTRDRLKDIVQNESRNVRVRKPDFGLIEAKVLTMRMNTERNPLRQVTLVARSQRIVPTLRFVLPVKGGFRLVMRGVTDTCYVSAIK